MLEKDCIFCRLDNIKFILENDLAGAFWDRSPVSTGHLLLIPKRHCQNYFDLIPTEIAALHQLTLDAKALLDADFQPDGYNIGSNIGVVGGQTVMHCHLHLIPRYKGDDVHPAGGIRKIFPHGGEF